MLSEVRRFFIQIILPLFVFQPLIFKLQFSIFTLLRLLIESPCQSHHAIAGDDVVEGLGHALGIDVVARVAELAEDVEGIKLQEEIALEESLCQSGIPQEFVGVHVRRRVTPSLIHRQVGGELHVPRQLYLSGKTVVEVGDVDGDEVLAVAR